MKHVATIAVWVTGALLLFHFFFIWMYTNIDGYYYWAFGQYVKTGIYPFIQPFVYERPPTISPPLYGIFLAFLGVFPRADILLHAVQLLMISFTAYLLYRMISPYIKPVWSTLIACLFLLFPANIIYVSSMMTEIPAQTAMTVYLYLTHRFLATRRQSFLEWAVLLSAIMTLLKYQFFFLFVFTIGYLVVSTYQTRRFTRLAWIKTGTAILIIAVWVSTNYAITGVKGLSDSPKMPFYTNFVWEGKYYPNEQDPSVIALRRYVPITVNKYGQYWDLQDYILPHVNRSWHAVDELLGNVGIAAVRTHPGAYVINGLRVFIASLTHTRPWWDHLATYGTRDPNQPLYCDALGTIQFCQPLIFTPLSYTIWNTYVRWSRAFYDAVMPPVFLVLFLPSLLIVLITRTWKTRIYAVIYLVNLLPISYLSMAESRYLIPYYPLIIIITAFGIKKISSLMLHFVSQTHDKK